MKKALTYISLSAVAFALPLVSLAAINDIKDVGSLIIDTINNIFVPVLFAIAFIVFIYGVFTTFILGASSDDVKTKGKSYMLYGLIGFFVMVSVWGLVNILTSSAGLGNNQGPTTIPKAGPGIGR